MSIQEIMSLGGSKISANVNFEDLKAFADYLIQKTKEEVEESILAKYNRENETYHFLKRNLPSLCFFTPSKQRHLIPIQAVIKCLLNISKKRGKYCFSAAFYLLFICSIRRKSISLHSN